MDVAIDSVASIKLIPIAENKKVEKDMRTWS